MSVCVIGLGKIGLPLAIQISKSRSVIGVDRSESVIQLINEGEAPFPGETGLNNALREALELGSFRAQQDLVEAISKSQVIIVVIPLITDENHEPKFAGLDEISQSIAMNIKKGTLVSFETTLPIGCTRKRFASTIEELSGLKVGEDIFIVYSPERVSSGNVFLDFSRYPKIVGGISELCGKKGMDFYSDVLEFQKRDDLGRENGVWDVGSSEAAEFVKLSETTYRDVNIALANEFENYAQILNLDFEIIREAANSQPFSHIHKPGISVGGHCIPVYPYFYLYTHPNSRLVLQARQINEENPKKYLERIKEIYEISSDSNILILGLSYRPGVKEHAFSGTFVLEREISARGAKVFVFDPLYSTAEITNLKLRAWNGEKEIDGVILHTDFPQFKDFDLTQFKELKFVLDGRNFYSNSDIHVPLL